MPYHLTIANQEAAILSLETVSGTIPVIIKRSHRRTFQLAVNCEGVVTFKIPVCTAPERIQALLKSKATWIARARARVMRRLPRRQVRGYHDGVSFFVFGCSRILHVQEGVEDWLKFYEQSDGWLAIVPERYNVAEQDKAVGKALELWFRREAQEYLFLRLDMWSRKMGLARPRFLIKRHKWLWGSCNKARRVINLNWRIISFPSEIIDYVIIHELCHLYIANHSKRFWAEVFKWCPQWRKLRRWLNEEAYRHVVP